MTLYLIALELETCCGYRLRSKPRILKFKTKLGRKLIVQPSLFYNKPTTHQL